MQEQEDKFKNNSIVIGCIIIAIALFIFSFPIYINSQNNKKAYEELLANIENKDWVSAKDKISVLENYKNTKELSYNVNYNYYIEIADSLYADKNFQEALNNYEKAIIYKTPDIDIENKINEVKAIIEKQQEIERIEQEKKELEEKKRQAEIEANKPSVDKLVILSKGFGYSQYVEASVKGKIKNNNKQTLFIRADIDLLDSQGNITGTTYTYEKIGAGKIWNFIAPTFGAYATDMDIHLSIDEE